MTSVAVRPGHPAEARDLLEASHALMNRQFPSESNHYLSIEALAAPDVRFFVAEADGPALGCGALKLRDGYGEVKSMFTAEGARGRGVGDAVLAAVLQAARAEGLPMVRLETGDSLHAAHRLYERHGFLLCGPFGDYRDDPRSLFYEKPL